MNVTSLAQDISQEEEECIILAKAENHEQLYESMGTGDVLSDQETAQLPSTSKLPEGGH
jgi:hypothetical protein